VGGTGLEWRQRKIPKSLIAALRRHITCLRDAIEHCKHFGRPATQ